MDSKQYEIALSAWRQDAAARLLTYVGLRESGLIGSPTQVDVTLIMPTLAMLDQDADGEYLERCELCGEPIPDGAAVAAVEIEPEYTRDACAKCLPDHAIYKRDCIDVAAAVAKARAVLAIRDDEQATGEE